MISIAPRKMGGGHQANTCGISRLGMGATRKTVQSHISLWQLTETSHWLLTAVSSFEKIKNRTKAAAAQIDRGPAPLFTSTLIAILSSSELPIGIPETPCRHAARSLNDRADTHHVKQVTEKTIERKTVSRTANLGHPVSTQRPGTNYHCSFDRPRKLRNRREPVPKKAMTWDRSSVGIVAFAANDYEIRRIVSRITRIFDATLNRRPAR